ncbi:hypothetical protein BXY70_0857 [Roseovarius halotolerans]|uniref:DUF2155 domain-containing protein n=1 Tax=Roseovarius halotolerans TaxID=505353 RepID=A0A1X6YEL2_9RHOB|nr:DUF2155 domain-containing protein [Roseovarius halotolerans]RKT34833.1 hypothetical protein BXY70_0857 [Roseovarius halotolerans]SLN18191.1 hypothetical protein ROH8110_00540 [Roseovarius halotolerans]
MKLRAAILSLALALAAGVATQAQEVSIGTGAVLRGLDKINGTSVDLTLAAGESGALGKLTVTLQECRYPAGDAAADAFAFLTVTEPKVETPVFKGWMIASSPALNAMQHARYDVWVLRCRTE